MIGGFQPEARGVKYPPEVERWLFASRTASSGAEVTSETAWQCTAILRCILVLAGTAAQLPLKVYRRVDGGKEPAPEHPVSRVLRFPNPEWTSYELRERMMVDALIWGSPYCQLILNGKGEVVEIWPLEANKITVERPIKRGPRQYLYQDGTDKMVLSEGEMLIAPLLSNGLKGRSLLDLAREAIGLSLTSQEFAARFFSNDATPRLIVKTGADIGPEKKKEFLEAWNSRHGGVKNAHGVGFIKGAEDIKVLETDLDKLQLTEARRLQVEEVCRIFGVPPHLVFALDRATNNNIEHQGIDYVTHSANPWLKRFEERLNLSLFGTRERDRYFCEFEVSGLQRGDYQSRTEGYARLIASAVMTPNEARRMENMNPVDGGDEIYIQGAMVPARLAGAQFQQQGGDPNAA